MTRTVRTFALATAFAMTLLLSACGPSSAPSTDHTPSEEPAVEVTEEAVVEEGEAEPAAPAVTWQDACIFTNAEVTAAFAASSNLTPTSTTDVSTSSSGPSCGYPHGDLGTKYNLGGTFEIIVSHVSYPSGLGTSSSTWNTTFQAPDRAAGFAAACAVVTADKQANSWALGPICEAGTDADIVYSPTDVSAWVFRDGTAWQVYANGGILDDQGTMDGVMQLARLAASR